MNVKTIKVKTNPAFGAAVCAGAKDFLAVAAESAKNILLVSDDAVYKLYGQNIKRAFEEDGYSVFTFNYPAAENGKSKHLLDKLLILMTEIDLSENDLFVAMGGQATSSLVGFAAAIFKGGISYVNLPTTLYAMTGSCISGRVGVDFLGRNDLFSAIKYPQAVFCDTEIIRTQNKDGYSRGLAEIVRSAIVGDKRLFTTMLADEFSVEEGIVSALKLRAKTEVGGGTSEYYKKRLALGEPFAHAARVVSHYVLTEGEALAAGLILAAEVSEAFGEAIGIKEQIIEVFNRISVKYSANVKKDEIAEYILSDEKIKTSGIELILIKQPGNCVTRVCDAELLKEVGFGR